MILNKASFRRTSLLALAALTTFGPLNGALKQTDEMSAQTRWVVDTINARHYLRDSIDQLDGAEMVEAYTKSFDNNRMYFLRSEIDDFIFRFGDAMEEFLEKGNLYAAFEIYRAYLDKVQERTDWVYERLDQDFDFTVDESFRPDRREEQWPESEEAHQSLWERRLKYELLNELLSISSEYKDDAVTEVEEDQSEKSETKKPVDDAMEINSPDVFVADEDEFDPSKIERLLKDPEFFNQMLVEAKKKIHRRYERNLQLSKDRETAEIQESFINSMTQLFDPHSSFLSADTLEGFTSAVQNSFVGIGALLQDEDGICTIKQILPGGPAEESGLLNDEDQILGVAQGKDGEFEDVVDMQLRYIVRKIKGEEGTVVRLLIRPGDAVDPSVRKEISIVRGEVKLTANLASAKLITVPIDAKETVAVGVIELPSFYGNIGAGGTLTTTSDDVEELINKLRFAGAEGIILDLRMNGGGLLSEAVRLTGLFIPVGPVVQILNNTGQTEVLSDRDPSLVWDGPLIVLTSRFSASASEIVAGALQDHKRALIVGNSSTHGKGTVQEVFNMNPNPIFAWFKTPAPKTRPVASKITIKQFFLPGGSSTQLKGVPSDIVLPSVNEFLPIGESDLPHALAWEKIPSVDWVNNWEKLNIASPNDKTLRSELISNSAKRQEALEEFTFLKDQIEWRRKQINEKDFSLNLSKRIQKKIADQAYIEELETTYEALNDADYSFEEILLNVAEEQEAESRKNLAESAADIKESKEEDEDDAEKDYDIYLRESARIMADWILIENSKKTAVDKRVVGGSN